MGTEQVKPVLVREGGKLSQLTTDQLIEEITIQGGRLSSLYQRDDGLWKCNIDSLDHDGRRFKVPLYMEYGIGPTFRTAVMIALHNMYYYRNTKGQTYRRHVNRDFR